MAQHEKQTVTSDRGGWQGSTLALLSVVVAMQLLLMLVLIYGGMELIATIGSNLSHV